MKEQKLNVDLSKCHNERCTCGNMLWRESSILKRIPAALTGNIGGEDTYFPVDILACAKCGRPHKNYMKYCIEPPPLTVSKAD